MYRRVISESSWLKGLDFLKSPNCPYKLCSAVIKKMKSRKIAPGTELIKNETHEMTTFTAHVTINASPFQRQKYSSYGKLFRIVAYMLRILPTFQSQIYKKIRCNSRMLPWNPCYDHEIPWHIWLPWDLPWSFQSYHSLDRQVKILLFLISQFGGFF